MKLWKEFWKNRKRSDRVKIMLYLGIAAVVFLVLTAVDIINLIKYINTPTEYIISCSTVSDAALDQLTGIDGIGAVTPQKNSTLTLKHNANETVMEAACISKEYAKAVFGVEPKGEMTTIFANSNAYNRILSELVGTGGSPDLHNEIKVEFLDGDKYKACQIINIHQEINAENPFVFMITADSILKKHADSIRAFVPRQDTELLAVGRIRNLGYGIMNQEDILSFHNQIDRLFLEIKYQLIIAAMCGLWIMTLRRYASEK